MDRSQWHIRIVFNEIGDPLSGHDAPCADGQYRKCRTVFVDGERSLDNVARACRNVFPDAYDIQPFGPYGNTAGD